MKQYQRLFSLEGVKLDFTEGALRAIAEQALKHGTGARGLRSIMEGMLLDLMYELPGETDITEVVVTEQVVREGAEPTLVREGAAAKAAGA